MIRTILVPLDGSAFSEKALPLSQELAHALNARLVLTCVAGAKTALPQSLTVEDLQAISEQYAGVKEEEHLLSTSPGMVEKAQEQIRSVAEANFYISRIASQMVGRGIKVEVAVPFGNVEEGILTEIDLQSADLVIMSAQGRSGLNRLISRSVAAAVVARSPVPVLLVPRG